MKSSPCSPQLEKAHAQQRRPNAAKKKKQQQNYNSKRYMYPYVHSSAIHNSQDMETT